MTSADLTAQLQAQLAAAQKQITELEHANAQLHDRLSTLERLNSLQRSILKHAGMAVITTDLAGIVTSLNPAAERMLGYAADELIGRSAARTFLEPDELAQRMAQYIVDPATISPAEMAAQFSLHQTVSYELTHIRKSGERFPALVTLTTIEDDTGAPGGYISLVSDITIQKQAEYELRALTERFELAIHVARLAIWELTIPTQEIRCDARMHEIFGVEVGALGNTLEAWVDRIHPDDHPMIQELLETIQRGEDLVDQEFRVIQPDGSLRFVRTSGIIVKDLQGRPERMLGVNLEITRQKLIEEEQRQIDANRRQSEEALRKANAELARNLRLRDEFLATISHELRTPLNSILGFTEILLEQSHGPLNQRQTEALQFVAGRGHHLLALINDILDLSKIEANRLDLQFGPCSIESVCQVSLRVVGELAQIKGISLHYTTTDTVAMVSADQRRLKQILTNLLSNAIKFTPAGGQVHLEALIDKVAQTVRFTVADTGIGIAADDLPRLFRPFTQLDASLARRYEGTGLGLVLVERLTTLHRGTVSVTSELGKGSRFSVTLPLVS